MGLPGALNYRGLLHLNDGTSNGRSVIYKNQTLCTFDSSTDTPNLGAGYCPRIWPAFSYLGMSTTIIKTRANKKLIIGGSPRYGLNGAIQIQKIHDSITYGGLLRLNSTINGYFKTSYFGYSVASVDVNGDG
jgi:hypothetical protein